MAQEYRVGYFVKYFKNNSLYVGFIKQISFGYISQKKIYEVNDHWVYADAFITGGNKWYLKNTLKSSYLGNKIPGGHMKGYGGQVI